jgi:hypothetical protein
MTRAEALNKTKERFTNLFDGKVLPNATVSSIISYYESLVEKNTAPPVERSCGIMDNFREAEYKQWVEDNEWYS